MDIRDLKETAALAHLNMSEQELAAAFPAFEQMLGYFAAMQAADRDEAAFTAAITGHTDGMTASSRLAASGFFRPDTTPPRTSGDPGEPMLAKAGERDGRFIVVPNVL